MDPSGHIANPHIAGDFCLSAHSGLNSRNGSGFLLSVCIKDQIQNMNLVIGCTVGCDYCYARNNVRRWHMIEDFSCP